MGARAQSRNRSATWTAMAEPSARNAESGGRRRTSPSGAPYSSANSPRTSAAPTAHVRQRGRVTWYATVPPSRWRV